MNRGEIWEFVNLTRDTVTEYQVEAGPEGGNQLAILRNLASDGQAEIWKPCTDPSADRSYWRQKAAA